ncbi:MAG: hypothetical protein HY331_07010 [Chloroflexi bacterium]|nr:hypothetical protein [Chloroflexota bacterium]
MRWGGRFLQVGGVVMQSLTIRLQPAAFSATATATATATGTPLVVAGSPTPVLQPLFAFTADGLLTTSAGETTVTQLGQPLTIAVAYDPEEVRARRLDEATLQIWVVNEPSGVLEALPTTVDRAGHRLTAVLPHLSSFVVRAQQVPYRVYLPIWKLGMGWSFQGGGW